jgi:DNA polymerase III subunit delta'
MNEGTRLSGFAAIDGQDAALLVLQQALANGQLGAAYLFVGPSGVGKQLAAVALACAAVCAQQPGVGCGACEPCRRIAQGVHPDVRIFAPRDEGNRNIPVDYLRNEILPLTKFAPFEASSAFLIFPQADLSFPIQHPEAANALLKTLEEPRPNLHFILLSERPDRLLPTIRSRCQRVRFAPLKRTVLDSILARHGVAESAREQAMALSSGRADRALELSLDERASRMLDWALRVDELLEDGSPGQLLEAVEQLASEPNRALLLESLATYYRELAAEALGVAREPLVSSDRAQLLVERAQRVAPSVAARRVARIQQASEDLEQRNANPQLALEGLLFELRAT